jgi:hypothetical protein
MILDDDDFCEGCGEQVSDAEITQHEHMWGDGIWEEWWR